MKLHAFKNGKKVSVTLEACDMYHKPSINPMIDPTRVFSCDTESLLSEDGETYTLSIQLSFGLPQKELDKELDRYANLEDLASNPERDKTVVLNTWKMAVPWLALLDYVFPLYAEEEENPSRTQQREKKPHKNGTYRNGIRQKIPKIVGLFYNGEYDNGRLFRNHEGFQKAALIEEDNVRFPLGDYEIEVRQLSPWGSAPRFDFFIRKDGKILQIVGRDLWAYWKTGLGKTAEALKLAYQKDNLEEELRKAIELHNQQTGLNESYRDIMTIPYEHWTDTERRVFKDYSIEDARTTRGVGLITTKLLAEMDEHVIRRDGLIPVSAPNASAVMCFAGIPWELCDWDKEKLWDEKNQRFKLDLKELREKERDLQNTTYAEILSAYHLPSEKPILTQWEKAMKSRTGSYRHKQINERLSETLFYRSWEELLPQEKVLFHQRKELYTDTCTKMSAYFEEKHETTNRYRVFSRPSDDIMQFGAHAYAGGRVSSLFQGILFDIICDDISSAYPFWMSEIPDPVLSEYKRIEQGTSILELKGKMGIICVSGAGTDENYPALRYHDENEGGRLRGVYGPFKGLYTTIAEAVIGVVSGRLTIETIHDGYYMDGNKETSFIRKHILRLYKLKTDHKKDPIGLLAKLLMNALYGKFVEINQNNSFIGTYARVLPAPKSKLVTRALYEKCVHAFVSCEEGMDGTEALLSTLEECEGIILTCHTSEDKRAAFQTYSDYLEDTRFDFELIRTIEDKPESNRSSEDTRKLAYYYHCFGKFLETIKDDNFQGEVDGETFGDWFARYRDTECKAGRFYNPFWGALITGGASAQLGLWMYCMESKQGDTDSGIGKKQSNTERRVAHYHELMEEAGYSHPETGLGSFEREIGSYQEGLPPKEGDTRGIEGIFIRSKVYSIKYEKYVELKDGSFQWKTFYKRAQHGIGKPDIGLSKSHPDYQERFGEYLHEKFRSYVEQRKEEGFTLLSEAKIEYTQQKSPRPVRQSFITKQEPGVFESKERTFHPDENPHMEIDQLGNRVWKPMESIDTLLKTVEEDGLAVLLTNTRVDLKNGILYYSFEADTMNGVFTFEYPSSKAAIDLHLLVKKEKQVRCKVIDGFFCTIS